MDYSEEQKSEIEALESIYYGEVKIITEQPHYKFSIPIKSEEYDPDIENSGLACDLVFSYSPKYPEEPPEIELDNTTENFLEQYKHDLINYLGEQVKENIGMVMIFTLVSSAQEWLNVTWERVKKHMDAVASKKLQEEEEAERKRFEGTRVTVESFMKWKAHFEDDMGITKKREAIEKEGKKLTGRELFMTDKTLNESDLKFLEDGDNVKVDESLFQDMDDLDLDDEDYDPNCSYSTEESSDG